MTTIEQRRLPARDLDLVTQLHQNLRHALTVVSLNFDHAFLHRPAGAAFLLELLGKGFHVLFREDKVFHYRHNLPATPA